MRRVQFFLPATVAAALLITACGPSATKTDEKSESAKPALPPAEPVDPAQAGTITGKVAFSGTKPKPKVISMDAVPACANQHKEPLLAQDTLVNPNGTLQNVFVYVKAGLPQRQWPVPAEAVAMDQRGCQYEPRVLGVMVGQDLAITNNDPTNHNIHPIPANNREWNESQPPKGEKKIKTFDKEEVMIPFKCNVHPWMRAYVGVVAHPFFAVTGSDGSFSLKGLPPGEYTLEAWHEKLGTQEIKVTVAPKETKTADFAFKSE
jgi:plastocyanin